MRAPKVSAAALGLIVCFTLHSSVTAAEAKLAPGTAKGSFTALKKENVLAFATVFVDSKDERKPTILILSDKKLPAEKWKTSGDLMMYRMATPFVGVAFFLDSKREVFRTDYYDGSDFPTSSSGIFTLKLDPAVAGSLSGSAISTPAAAEGREPVKLNVTFNAKK
jgi:hypothetical protein